MEIRVDDLRPRSVEFTSKDMIVSLADGRRLTTPLDWYPTLKRASLDQLNNYQIMPMGIHWPDLDEDLSIAGMLKGDRVRSDTVKELVKFARSLSKEDIERQRRSFVYGNTALDNNLITRALIEDEADRLARESGS